MSFQTRRQLAHLQSRGAKEEYMESARQLKDYGYIHFDPCTCDYPMTNTNVDVLIGGRELIIRIPAENSVNYFLKVDFFLKIFVGCITSAHAK